MTDDEKLAELVLRLREADRYKDDGRGEDKAWLATSNAFPRVDGWFRIDALLAMFAPAGSVAVPTSGPGFGAAVERAAYTMLLDLAKPVEITLMQRARGVARTALRAALNPEKRDEE